MKKRFEVTILGCGSATPTSFRNPTSQVLRHGEKFFLIDCGEGTQMQLRRNKVNFAKLNHIFISHLHGDHFYGLIGLISSYNLLGLKNDIHIYSASELKNLIQPLLNYLQSDIPFKIIFHPLNLKKAQQVYADKHIEVISFPVKHSIPTCGFLFRETIEPLKIRKEMVLYYQIPIAEIKKIKAGADFVTSEGKVIPNNVLTIQPDQPRAYAFCTDTAYYEPIIKIIESVDTLYHESTFTDELEELAQKTCHATARQAARIAKLAGAGKLLIGHFSSRYNDTAVFEHEAREVFENCTAVSESETYAI